MYPKYTEKKKKEEFLDALIFCQNRRVKIYHRMSFFSSF